jgi:Transposase DDE domain
VWPYIRTVKTASGATAVQIVHSNRRGSREIEHIGSAHTPEDEVFKALALARVIEPTSKLDTIRVLEEIGIVAPSYPTINRRLPVFASVEWRQQLARACAAHVGLGPATLVIYDVTTLYFETDQGDGFREPGFSKERRLEPQITVGLLTDARGFPLTVHAFEGNTAETKTILPVIQAFAAAHRISEVTVVADAGMLSEANLAAIEDAGLRFIVGARIPEVPYQVAEWCRTHPGEPIGDGQIFTQPWLMGTKADPRKRMIFYHYRADRARRTLKGSTSRSLKRRKPSPGRPR